MPVDPSSVSLEQVALLNQRSGFILMGAAEGSREQAEEWDSWLESHRESDEIVDAALQSHRIVDRVVVKVLVFAASWWELADGPMRFAATVEGMSAAYLVPRDGRPMPEITSYSPPDPARGSTATLAASLDGQLDHPDQHRGAARALREQAEEARAGGHLAQADAAMIRAFQILGDPKGPSLQDNWRDAVELALAAQRLGDSMYTANQADGALRWWTMALAIIGPLAPQSAPAADLNRSLGALHRSHGDLDKALACSERALAISLDEKPLAELAFVDVTLVASVRRQRKEFDEARQLLAGAIELAETIHVSDGTRCRLLHTAGDVERDSGDRDAARGFYERASTIAEATDPFSEEAVTLLIKLGEVENECGRSDAALQHLERALAVAETSDPDSLPAGAALLALSRVHLDRHAPEQARAYHHRAEQIMAKHAPA